MTKKRHFYFCVLMPPPRVGGGNRPRYYLIKGSSAKAVFKLFTRKLCHPAIKRKFKKEFIHDGYYYYDGIVYIEKLMDLKKVQGFEKETIYSTGYFHELCRECIVMTGRRQKKKKKKKKKLELVD